MASVWQKGWEITHGSYLAVWIWQTSNSIYTREILASQEADVHEKRHGHILRGCVFWVGMITMCVMSPGNLYNYQFHNLCSVWAGGRGRGRAVWDMGTMGEVRTRDPASWLHCQPASETQLSLNIIKIFGGSKAIPMVHMHYMWHLNRRKSLSTTSSVHSKQ